MPRFFVDRPLAAGETLSAARRRRASRARPAPADRRRDHALRRRRRRISTPNSLEIAKRTAIARIDEHRDREAEPPYRVTLAQGVAGGDKMDWLIEKSVELGVAAIVPLTAERGVVRLAGERAAAAVRRTGRRSSRAACEQCGRNRVPEVSPRRISTRGSNGAIRGRRRTATVAVAARRGEFRVTAGGSAAAPVTLRSARKPVFHRRKKR